MYIDDCIEGTRRIMDSDVDDPINLGSSEMVSINQLVDLVEEIAGVNLVRRYALDAPKGVRGRNSDNTMIRERLGWEPSVSLRSGLAETYRWIFDQVLARALVTSSKERQRQPLLAVPRAKAAASPTGQDLAA
jgi:nucleoside-diphosphate-sugar epimerase